MEKSVAKAKVGGAEVERNEHFSLWKLGDN